MNPKYKLSKTHPPASESEQTLSLRKTKNEKLKISTFFRLQALRLKR